MKLSCSTGESTHNKLLQTLPISSNGVESDSDSILPLLKRPWLSPLVCLEAFLCHLQWTTGNSNSCPTSDCLLFLGSLHWCVASCSASTEPSHPLTQVAVPLLELRIPMLWPDQCCSLTVRQSAVQSLFQQCPLSSPSLRLACPLLACPLPVLR